MSKKKLVMIDLSEDKAKKVAKAITNSSCRKILEFLADKEATATEISKELKLGLSTVHYNLSQLVDAELVLAENYHYSKKMKEVLHYKLANQYILIAPRTSEGFNLKEKLMNLLPAFGLAAVGGLFIHFFDSISNAFSSKQATALTAASQDAMAMFVEAESVDLVVQSEPNFALWFFVGAVFIIAVLLLTEYIKFLRGKRK